ncbi:endothelin-converting enzyme 2 protein [Elysia marginata]|uniref:Endothelin-converting enzyme 2 protein n=1 Tax=Elysia marginata TaxID=1093978 RepID=A0AAV4HXG8_9GAST|nr:endothelin-converting enzyme 2 protein [Elysia marginata]
MLSSRLPSSVFYVPQVNTMIDNLKVEFENQLHTINWMGKKTKAEAFKKLALMARQVGYPDKGFSEEDIDEESEHFKMKADKYYENRQILKSKYRIKALMELTEKTDKTRSLNYGRVGHIIGHEITHGFDDIGSQFDLNGNFRNWWQPQDMKNFRKACQCIVRQYSSFYDNTTELYVNGITTQGENVADNGGLKQSYRAYKKLTAQKGEPELLPGLRLTNDQLFFLAYAQLWCEKSTKETRRQEMLTLNHPPGEFRILGSLQNSPEFSAAYDCPIGSTMNPQQKCSVW